MFLWWSPPIADAIAMGIDPEKNQGSMIVNIGAQSTEFSIITDGKIIISRKIPIGGRQMNESILQRNPKTL